MPEAVRGPMALIPRLELRQSQTLVMTPQLLQAIRLLQFSNLELSAYVADELEKNPLLERDERAPDGAPDAPAPAAAEQPDAAPPPEAPSRAAMEDRLGTDLENVFPDDRPVGNAPPGAGGQASQWQGGGGEAPDLEAYVASDETLADHLKVQLGLAVTDPRDRLIGLMLIGLIDDAGYLSETVETVAERLAAPVGDVERVLGLIQGFEPSGVGARSLAECLAIQLAERNRFDPAMQALVGNLDRLARRDFPALRAACGVDDEDLAEMIDEIRQLTPKPGLCFGAAPVQPVVPDAFVRPAAEGGWLVELNSETLPRVLVNQSYFEVVSGRVRSTEEKGYLSECLQSANWLVRSLEQRARTILKVSGEIVRQQDAFLARGVAHLRPLNLRTVADAIGMHESTVSRVTSNKYLATPRGVFELKYFFSASIGASDGGEAHSAEAVRHRIRRMIDAEPADDVLSDDTIVQRLQADGVDIARRTVAKYREGMGIPSSVQRRRSKRIMEPQGGRTVRSSPGRAASH